MYRVFICLLFPLENKKASTTDLQIKVRCKLPVVMVEFMRGVFCFSFSFFLALLFWKFVVAAGRGLQVAVSQTAFF